MLTDQLIDVTRETLTIMLLLSMPVLMAGLIIGLVISVLQAVTQIQEQTLPQTIKIFAIAAVLLVFGTALASPLYAASDKLFSSFHTYEPR